MSKFKPYPYCYAIVYDHKYKYIRKVHCKFTLNKKYIKRFYPICYGIKKLSIEAREAMKNYRPQPGAIRVFTPEENNSLEKQRARYKTLGICQIHAAFYKQCRCVND